MFTINSAVAETAAASSPDTKTSFPLKLETPTRQLAWGGVTVTTKKEFPFHDPTASLRVDDWDTDLVSTDSMYVMISGQDAANGKDIDTIVKEGRIPLLCITATLFREIRYLVEKNAHSELAMFLTMKKLHETKPIFMAFDFFMPGQEASSGGVSLDAQDCRKYFNSLKDVPYYKEHGLHRNLCHLHSHGKLKAFWSSIDDTQQFSKDDLGFMDDYRFYVVVNAAGEIKCSLVTYVPVVTRVDAVVAVSFSRPSHIEWLSKKRKAELDALFKEMVIGTPATRVSEVLDSSYFGEFPDFHGYRAFSGTRGVTSNLVNPADKKSVPATSTTIRLVKDAAAVNAETDIPRTSVPESVSNLTNFLHTVTEIGSWDVKKVENEIRTLTGSAWYEEAKTSFIGKIFEGEKPQTYDIGKATELFAYSMKVISLSSNYRMRMARFSKEVQAKDIGSDIASYMLTIAEMYDDPETFLDMLEAYTECMDINDPTVPSEDVAQLVTQFDQLINHNGGYLTCSEDLLQSLMTDMQYIVKSHMYTTQDDVAAGE